MAIAFQQLDLSNNGANLPSTPDDQACNPTPDPLALSPDPQPLPPNP